MDYVTKGLEPADAWRHFEDLTTLPHGSRNEEAAARYVEKFAKEKGLWVKVDEMYNVIVKKPGSKGCEHLPPVMLQGHLDMVCEKDPGVEHDFETQSLQLELKDGVLRAKGTTLGADDGVAIAYMMAVLGRDDLVHPPLECVMTTQEEIGLIGAMHLDGSDISARRMIGMDAGGEGLFLVGSAGGNFVDYQIPFTRVPVSGEGVEIAIGGLKGGHSGVRADAELGNAVKLMGRLLYRLSKTLSFSIGTISGGTKINAIPREAKCTLVLHQGTVEQVKEIVSALEQEVKTELAFSDPEVFFTVNPGSADTALDKKAGEQLIHALHLTPNGRQAMSKAIPGLVSVSLNVSSVVLCEEEGKILVPISVRSAEDSMTKELSGQLVEMAQVLGFTARVYGDYPAFAYSPQSPLRDKAMALFKEMTGREAEVCAVHGGTECGVFRSLCPGIDIIGFGPDTGDAHIPTEWVNVESFRSTFGFLVALLEELTH